MRLTAACVKSLAEATASLLSRATTMTSELDSRLRRVSLTMRPFLSSESICAASAEKKMSAGAPSWICRASVLEAAKLSATFSPVCRV